ncbi:AAA family ATPase [Cellulomonas chitinilytica]|uniref:AAA family ATPase n=1 Tax=Cellulomonas chitinilytica TaxID=398759 RepID=UPI001942D6FE|nr:AAA family ATPase [Cellulomonas chitinilytica]
MVLSGTVGAGKTTVAGALRRELVAQGHVAAELDVDGVARQAPAPPADPFNERLVVAHLRALRSRWERAGVDVLVLPRVVETVAQRDAYADAVGRPVRVVRIDAPASTRRRRLVARHDAGPDRDWHLARTDSLAAILAVAAVEDVVVVNDRRPPSAVATEILAALGWSQRCTTVGP